ncbi:hypothetical protein A2U01_0066161, partial [Trifolium medium]|nr:hypothetical protein [Trifolium medium]
MYQLDVKSAFLHGKLMEDVCVEQSIGYQKEGNSDVQKEGNGDVETMLCSPIVPGNRLTKDEGGKLVDATEYRQMIG